MYRDFNDAKSNLLWSADYRRLSYFSERVRVDEDVLVLVPPILSFLSGALGTCASRWLRVWRQTSPPAIKQALEPQAEQTSGALGALATRTMGYYGDT